MDARKLASDIIVAFLAQALSIASSVVTTLLLPKFLGIEDFGYWQLFLFYVSYLGFFHLGINDGIYLIKGGEPRNRIDKKEVNSEFVFSCSYQLLMSITILAVAAFGPFEEKRAFVISATGLLLTISNAEFFLGYVFQAMNETKLFSASAALETLVFFALVIPLLLTQISDFEPFIYAYCTGKIARLLYCVLRAKDFISAGLYPLRKTLRLSITSIRVGIKLMLSNIVGALILGIIRFFVDLEWGIEVFSVVSFSLSIASFFLMFLTQISMVLFPHLRQSSSSSVESYFVLLRNGLGLILPSIYVLYPLIALLLTAWVPEYSESIALFIYLFPLCVFDGKMDIVGTTYFKVLREEGALFKINAIILVASALATLFGTYIIHSVPFILTSVVALLGIRSLISEKFLSTKLGVKPSSISWTSILISFIFIALFIVFELEIALALYAVSYLLYLLKYKKELKNLVSNIRNSVSAKKGNS